MVLKTLFSKADIKSYWKWVQNWPHRNSIFLDEYITMGAVKLYLSSAE